MSEVGKPIWKRDRFKDLAFVVVLPILCLVLDPVLFLEASEAVKYAAYVLIPTLMLCFYLAGISAKGSFIASVLEGTLLLGTGIAWLTGLLLLPLSLLGLFFLIGVLGFIPFFTAHRFFLKYRSIRSRSPGDFTYPLGIILGLLLPFVVPFFVHQHVAEQQNALFEEMSSPSKAIALSALARLPVTWHCEESCMESVASLFEAGKFNLTKDEISHAFETKTGLTYAEFVNRMWD